jgi:hypothetical protein
MFISLMFRETHGFVESLLNVTTIIRVDSVGVIPGSVRFMTDLWHTRPLEATRKLSHTHTQS